MPPDPIKSERLAPNHGHSNQSGCVCSNGRPLAVRNVLRTADEWMPVAHSIKRPEIVAGFTACSHQSEKKLRVLSPLLLDANKKAERTGYFTARDDGVLRVRLPVAAFFVEISNESSSSDLRGGYFGGKGASGGSGWPDVWRPSRRKRNEKKKRKRSPPWNISDSRWSS